MTARPGRATICYLSDARSIHTRRWATHFAERGHDVHVVSFAPGEIPGATVSYVPLLAGAKAAGLLTALPVLRRILRRIRPSIIHAHYVTSYGIAGVLVGMRPLVITAWGSDVLVVPFQSRIMRQAVRWALSRADLVTCVAEHMAVTMRSLGLPRTHILSLPFGVDTNVFHPGRRSATPDIDVICTRPCDPIYNVELLIRSLPAIVARHKTLTCALVGGGAQEGDMRALAERLGVARHIRFVGVVPQPEIGAWLGRAKVFVSPALSDGNNISLNEGMACGCLPVCTDIPGNREWLTDAANGFLVPPDRPDLLADRIVEALRPEPARAAWLAHNWELVKERGNWNRNMAVMEGLYEQLWAPACQVPA